MRSFAAIFSAALISFFDGSSASSGRATIFAGCGSATAFQLADDDATSSITGWLDVIRLLEIRCFVDCARLRMSWRPESSVVSAVMGGAAVVALFSVVPEVPCCMLLPSRRASVWFGRASK